MRQRVKWGGNGKNQGPSRPVKCAPRNRGGQLAVLRGETYFFNEGISLEMSKKVKSKHVHYSSGSHQGLRKTPCIYHGLELSM